MSEATMTKEQEQLRADLVARYGEDIVAQANQLSGLQLCLIGLGVDELKFEERARLVRQAGMHLAELLDTVMAPEHSAKVVECAKRLDAAIETWMNDEIEKRDGLPPL